MAAWLQVREATSTERAKIRRRYGCTDVEPPSTLLVAVLGPLLLGDVLLDLSDDSARLVRLNVRRWCRRRGLGTALVRAVFDAARRLRLELLELHVHASNNAAIALYRREGFVVVDARADVLVMHWRNGRA